MKPCCRLETGSLQRPLLQTLAGGTIPGVLFFVMPKCPFCLAAYFSIATGLALPFPLTIGLHKALSVLCVTSVLLSVILFSRFFVVLRSMRIGIINVKNDLR